MRKDKKTAKIISLLFLFLIAFFVFFFFVGKPVPASHITWGVTFSQIHAQKLGLDWKDAYLSILDDLGVKNVRLIAYWSLIEKEPSKFDFQDLDWQIEQASKRNVKIILVVGQKVPRWPECFIPDWALSQKESREKELLHYLETVISRYKNNHNIWAWQVENEPFFNFGNCPKKDKELLKKEIQLVKKLDTRPIIITDSGEFSFWVKAAQLGDIIGHTLYKKVWFSQFHKYFYYYIPAIYYYRKAQIIKFFFHKPVICAELQAEPWGPVLLYNLSPKEQKKTMNPEQFKKIIEFAKNTGEDTFYLWGVEWWYWMKEKYNQPQIWNEAKKLFN